MKLFDSLLVLTLVIGFATGCTKLEESPEPGATTKDTTSTVNPPANPNIYIGLWKMTGKTLDGSSIFDANNTFTVKLDVGGMAQWTAIADGSALPPEGDTYILNTSPLPVTIDFIDSGLREVINKTATQIVWRYNDPKNGNNAVDEILTKQ